MRTKRVPNNPLKRDPKMAALWVMLPKTLIARVDDAASRHSGPPRDRTRRAEVERLISYALEAQGQ
jgi:hypothetical protein